MSGACRKVCHLRATNFFGGPEKQILEQARSLDERRWTSVVASFREGRERVEFVDRARDAGFETFLVDTESPFSAASIGILRRALIDREIDLLVTHGYKPDILGRLARRRGGPPQLIHMRGFTGESLRVRLYERADLWALRRAEGVICVSEAMRTLLCARGVSPERLHTIHNAVHVNGEIQPADLVSRFGVPPGTRTLVAAGRMSPEKGHAILIGAFEILASRYADLHLVILGDGALMDSLRTQARSSDCAGRIHLPGFERDVAGCFAASSLVVNPSLSEGLPNVVLEAFAAGAPVVATAVGGVPEIVEDGETGFLARPGDRTDLARAIETALADHARTHAIAERARRRAADELSFEAQAERLMALYDRSVA